MTIDFQSAMKFYLLIADKIMCKNILVMEY